jgi:hypothetical protein
MLFVDPSDGHKNHFCIQYRAAAVCHRLVLLAMLTKLLMGVAQATLGNSDEIRIKHFQGR